MEPLSWSIVVPCILAYGVMPVITFFFYCRYGGTPFKWRYGIIYMILSVGLRGAEWNVPIPGSFSLMAGIGLLGLCGHLFLKKGWREAAVLSVLIMCIFSVTNGLVLWLDRRVFLPVVLAWGSLIASYDGMRELLKVVLAAGLYVLVLRKFGKIISHGGREPLAHLTVPVFFIALVEKIIQASLYGDVLTIDSRTNQVLSVVNVNHGEILFLQLWACICLFAVLFSYEKIMAILREQHSTRLLQQQSAEQENYVREAGLRYQQTSSFRHDIKNHLTVLAELLKTGQTEAAYEYLNKLEEISESLSYPVHTGNSVVDALLGSKLSVARENGIRVECEIKIPGTGIADMDWCIVLANALDNAIAGCRGASEKPPYIRLTGKKKGNFYLVIVENSCDGNLLEVPEDGTGLGNIRAVMERNKGTVENTVFQGVYRLKLLFVDTGR